MKRERERVEFSNINQIAITENYFLKKVDSTLVLFQINLQLK